MTISDDGQRPVAVKYRFRSSIWVIYDAKGLDNHLPRLRSLETSVDAHGCVPIFLRVRGMWCIAQAFDRRLLRVLFYGDTKCPPVQDGNGCCV